MEIERSFMGIKTVFLTKIVLLFSALGSFCIAVENNSMLGGERISQSEFEARRDFFLSIEEMPQDMRAQALKNFMDSEVAKGNIKLKTKEQLQLEEELAREGLNAQIEFLQTECSKKKDALENENLEPSQKIKAAERMEQDSLFLDYLNFLKDSSSGNPEEKYAKYKQWKNSAKSKQLDLLNKTYQMNLMKSDLEVLKTRLDELNNPESFICRTFFQGGDSGLKKSDMIKNLQRQIDALQMVLEENFSN